MKKTAAPIRMCDRKEMKYLLCFFFLWNVYIPLPAVENLRLPDIRSVGMGGNGVTESFLYNPSLVALNERSSVHIQYFNLYGLKELSTLGGSFQYANPFLSLGVDISSFGYDAYRENRLRASVGKQLNSRWTAGVSLQYAWLQTEATDRSVSFLSADLGVSCRLVENLLIGLLIKDAPSFRVDNNPVEYKDLNTFSAQIGFQWQVINSMLIVATLGGSNEQKIRGNAGMEYTVWKLFHLRAGIQTAPLLPSFGIGYDFRCFTLDIAGVYHSILGIQTGIGLSFNF